MDNFEEAREKAMEMMENPPAEEADVVENTASEAQPPTEAANEQQEEITEQAVEAAERATQAVQTQAADIEALKNENSHLKALLNEMNSANAETVEGMQNQLPVLDLSNLAFDDDEQIKERTSDYTKQIMEYTRNSVVSDVLKKLEPIISKAQMSAEAQEQKEVLAVLEQVPELSGISGMEEQLNNIIRNNRALQNPELTKEEQLTTAMIIAKGVNAVNEKPKEYTYDDFVSMYENSPELQQYVERKRADKLKESQQVPNLSASNGAGGVALNIPNKPKTFDEAKGLVRKLLNY